MSGAVEPRTLREDAERIIHRAIGRMQPDEAVRLALAGREFPGRVLAIAAGKAAWQMAEAAAGCMGDRIEAGVVITKEGHAKGGIPKFRIYEGGHPLPNEGSVRGTQAAMELVENLTEKDTVLFLLSGGGSSLFEKPRISLEELQDITQQLLFCRADIVEINIIRKRLSQVKGGRFGKLCEPAHVLSIILSDVLGDSLDMIASGPACVDVSTREDAERIVRKYGLKLGKEAKACLREETVKELPYVTSLVTGSVKELCKAVCEECEALGYMPVLLTDALCCEAREAGSFLASILRTHRNTQRDLAFLAGGETVVKVCGSGKGGRNQELALAAAAGIDGLEGTAVFSVGSDGTDGPTDAAGGYVDGRTAEQLRGQGIDIDWVLAENDAYHALERTGGLIVTGPTGTNVNDVAVGLLKGRGQELHCSRPLAPKEKK